MTSNEGLVTQVNLMTAELESLQATHNGTLTQIDLIKQKGDNEATQAQRSIRHLAQLQAGVNGCVYKIVEFCKSNFAEGTVSALHVSKHFRDLMLYHCSMQEAKEPASMVDVVQKVEECLGAYMAEVKVEYRRRRSSWPARRSAGWNSS